MGSLGMFELAIAAQIILGLCVPLIVLYFIIRQAVLSALRKFYRERDESGKSKI